ncbi:transport and Golgi organization protein 2 isoform X2 [Colias croceus]|uniref:transport and Golgi organization protein 2 isoform X2 n=1 Tax=Colias crocea TaxID=72248 RepID=UPI001E27AA96|nr:transport and Golgi organization protein 2 isoform X2 [Colias croceus]
MCIIFIYNAFDDQESDYSLIIATNRDEYYDRPSINMSSWKEYPHVYGGRDMEAECQGTWNNEPLIQTYNNATNKLEKYNEACVGFSNSLPNNPLKKVEEGKKKMKDICEDHKKLENKAMLIEKLIDLLKWEERHLPDQVLQNRKPNDYHWFSSVFVTIPPVRYGTRTHTLLLVTKSGQVDLIEIYLQSPIDLSKPEWKRSDFQFNIKPNV